MSDVRTPLRRSGAPGALSSARLRLRYPAFGDQFPGSRDQAWRKGVINAEKAQACPRKTLLMLGNISRFGKRRQFCDEKPRKDHEPVVMAAGRPQDSGFHRRALCVHHEW